jgi:hypothetical protein
LTKFFFIVKFKDPHYFVVNATDGIIKKINEHVLIEEGKSKLFGNNKGNNNSSFLFENELDDSVPVISLVLPDSGKPSKSGSLSSSSLGSIPPLSPLGVATTRGDGLNSGKILYFIFTNIYLLLFQ